MMKKFVLGANLCVESVIFSFLLAGLGFCPGSAARAQNAADPAAGFSSQSYSVTIESSVGPDGKRVQKKKVWKDGVLIEDEEKTIEGDAPDGNAPLELDSQIAPGIILRNGTSAPAANPADPAASDSALGGAVIADPNAPGGDEIFRQMQSQMEAMLAQQEEMMKRFNGAFGFSPSDVISGFGFPRQGIPGAVASAVKPSEYWLGARVTQVDPVLRSQLALGDNEGILIFDVVPDSPSAKAGLQKYDILLKLGDQPVCDPLEIGAILDANGGEKALAVEFIRAGQRHSVELTPEKRPEVSQEPAGVEIQAGDGQAPSVSSDEKIRVVRPGMILPADADADVPAAEEGTK